MDQVLLVEDDVPTRQWLTDMLSTTGSARFQVVHACGTVREALAWLRSGQPTDIVLTDLGLPDGIGLEIIREASRSRVREVLVLSIFGDEKNVLAAIDAGAGGYLLKDGSLDSIHEHLLCLRSGGSPLSPRSARTLIRRSQQAVDVVGPLNSLETYTRGDPPAVLTERERDVLTGIGKGFSYAEVASALQITTNTVRTHVRRIYEKLAVNSRVEALYEYNRRMGEQGQPPIR